METRIVCVNDIISSWLQFIVGFEGRYPFREGDIEGAFIIL